MTEDRGRMTEDRGRMTDDGGRRGLKLEVGMRSSTSSDETKSEKGKKSRKAKAQG